MQDQQPQPHNDNQFWIGLFLGGLVGAMIIVLLGTEKGKKLAKKLQEEGLDFWEENKEKIGDLRSDISQKVKQEVVNLETKGEELVEKGKELIAQGQAIEEKVLEKAENVKEIATNQAVTTAYDTLSHIEALQERGRQTTAELKRKLFKNIPRKN